MTEISVVIPVYNRAHTIGRALESVAVQSCSGISTHIIVVDDHSSDHLASELGRYPNVSCVSHSFNRGAAAARNSGVAAAKGDYIAFLDSDDVWLPGKLAAQAELMRAHHWKASCTAYYLARPNRGEIVSPRYPTGALTFNEIVWGCFVSPGSTLMCERSLFDDIGAFETTLTRLEDWDWLLRYTRAYPLGFVAQPFARIKPSETANFAGLTAAISDLRKRHMTAMSGTAWRHFAAALDFQHAAGEYRRGNHFLSGCMLLKSLTQAPLNNGALAATLHNRLGRGRAFSGEVGTGSP